MSLPNSLRLSTLAVAFCLMALADRPASAASRFWSGTGTWDTAVTSNWGTVTGGPYNTATFVNGSDAVFEGTAGTVTISGTVQPLSMTFNTPGYVLNGGTISVTNGGPIINANQDVTISSTFNGTGASQTWIKNGAGTLTLTGATQFTTSGSVAINAGKVRLGASNVFANGPGSFPFNLATSSATLDINGFTDSLNQISGVAGSTVAMGGGSLSLRVGSNVNPVFNGNVTGGGRLSIVDGGGGGSMTLGGTIDADIRGSGRTLFLSGTSSVAAGRVIQGDSASNHLIRLTGTGTQNQLLNAQAIVLANLTTAVNPLVAFDPGNGNAATYNANGMTYIAGVGNGNYDYGSNGNASPTIHFGGFSGNTTFNGKVAVINGPVIIGAGASTGFVTTFTQAGTVYNGGNTITTVALVGDSVTFSSAISGSGGLTASGTGVLNLNAANFFTGATNIAASTGGIALSNSKALQYSTVTNSVANGLKFSSSLSSATIGGLAGASNLALQNASSGAVTLTIGANNAANSYTGSLSGSGGIVKIGTGTQTIAPAIDAAKSTYTGDTEIYGGNLTISFVNLTNASPILNVLSPSSRLVLGGGNLTVSGKSGQNATQTFNGYTVKAGNSILLPTVGTNTTIALGAANNARANGGTIMFQNTNTTNIVATIATANDASGILGGWAQWGAAANTASDFATVNGSNQVVQYAGYTATSASMSGVANANTNMSVGAPLALTDDTTFNTVKFPSAQTVTITATKTLTLTGGALLAPTGINGVINGGSIRPTAGSDLILAGAGGFNLAGTTIVDNGTSALTVSVGGTATLGSTNSYAGPTFLNAGTLSIASLANGGVNSSIGASSSAMSNLVFSGGTFSYTGLSTTTDRGFTINGAANIDVTTAGRVLTMTGGSTGRGNLHFFRAIGSQGGALVLAGSHQYEGTTYVDGFSAFGATMTVGLYLGAGDGGNIAGSIGSTTNRNTLIVGNSAGSRGDLIIQPNGSVFASEFNTGAGSIFSNTTVHGSLDVSGRISMQASTITQNAGSTVNAGEISMSSNAAGMAYNFNGGTLTTNRIVIINNTPTATGTLPTSGFFQAAGTSFKTGFITIGQSSAGGIVQTAGTMVVDGDIRIQPGGSPLVDAVFNQKGDSSVTVYGTITLAGGAASNHPFYLLGDNTGSTGSLLHIGSTITGSGTTGTTISTFKFNKGILQAHNALLGFSNILTMIETGGGTIDTNGFNVSTGQSFIVGGSSGGGFTKAGLGTLALSAVTHTYNGTTTVAQGTLALTAASSNPISSSPSIKINTGATLDVTGLTGTNDLVLASGQTIGGGGTINGSLTISSGSKLAPGNSPGTITQNSGSLTWMGGGALQFELNSASTTFGVGKGVDPGYDWTNVTGGTLDLTSLSNASPATMFTIEIDGLVDSTNPGLVSGFANTNDYYWTLVTASGGILGFSADEFLIDATGFTNPLGGGTFSVMLGDNAGHGTSNDLVLKFTSAAVPAGAVPEPGSLTLLACSLLGLFLAKRRRR